jgi:hypothetical protein
MNWQHFAELLKNALVAGFLFWFAGLLWRNDRDDDWAF